MAKEPFVQSAAQPQAVRHRKFLFVVCFIALVATSFAFGIRAQIIGDLQIEFRLTETQKGEILGAGLWPFGISIVVFSLVLDRIGYTAGMWFAFACHAVSTIMTIYATGYEMLYWGTFLCALGNGTVEAVINPAVASMYPKKKTTMLTILHAGWPMGIVISSIIAILMGGAFSWQVKIGLILIPTVVYGLMLLRAHFPVHERVAAGVSYREMLGEAGALGIFIASYMVIMELNRVFDMGTLWQGAFLALPSLPMTILLAAIVLGYLGYTRSLGRPMYVFLLLLMIILAITELGTDAWIKELMKPSMKKVGIDAGWVLVYTAAIMMILRLCIAPIVKVLKPLGVLLVSSLFAALGIYFLSRVEGVLILLMATIYGAGQCFFWPVTLGLVAEQFPRGGALTLNAIAGVGMLGVGILGGPLLGYWQDTRIQDQLQDESALVSQFGVEKPETVYDDLMSEQARTSVLGTYRSLDQQRVNVINDRVALNRYLLNRLAEREKVELVDGELWPKYREIISEGADAGLLAELKDNGEWRTMVRAAVEHLNPSKPDAEAPTESYAEQIDYLRRKEVLGPDIELYARAKEYQQIADSVTNEARQDAMARAAILPTVMAICYLGLIVYFRVAHGGYKTVELPSAGEAPEGEHEPTAEEFEDDAERTPRE